MLFFAASSSNGLNLFSGFAGVVYIILAIGLTGVSLYISIKKNRQDSKDAIATAITDKVLSDTKADIAAEVADKVATEVKEAVANIDYKITRNGKNTNNLGDVAARTEEKVDLVIKTVDLLALTVNGTNDRLSKHIGWHEGYEDSHKAFKSKKRR